MGFNQRTALFTNVDVFPSDMRLRRFHRLRRSCILLGLVAAVIFLLMENRIPLAPGITTTECNCSGRILYNASIVVGENGANTFESWRMQWVDTRDRMNRTPDGKMEYSVTANNTGTKHANDHIYFGSNIQADGQERLAASRKDYTAALDTARAKMISRGDGWRNEKIHVWPMMSVSEWDDTFFASLGKHKTAEVVIGYAPPKKHTARQLMHSPIDFLQRERYYVWSLDGFSCGRLHDLYADSHLFRGICEKGHNYFGLGLKGIKMSAAVHVQELYDYVQYHSRLHLIMVSNAYVEGVEYGYVYTKDMILVHLSCAEGWTPKPHELFANLSSGMATWPLYDEVFVAAQHWGTMYFHWLVEQLPKITTHLDFLKRNPQIRILINAEDDLLQRVIYRQLKMLGLDPLRVVRGQVRARLAYIPPGGGCVETFNPLAVQATSNLFLDIIAATLRASDPKPTRSILLIHRTGKRWLEQHNEIAGLLYRIARERVLELDVFTDNPTPSFDETMLRFNKAAVVVGPHGAGFSNVIYSRPGTVVLEVLCGPPDPTQYCYPFLSYALGLKHHGIGAVYGGCTGLIIHLAYLEAMVYMYLDEFEREEKHGY